MTLPASTQYIGGLPVSPDGGLYVTIDSATAAAARAMQAAIGGWYILAQSAVPVSGAADTNENTLATITVPANAMGPNGSLRVSVYFTFTGSTNAKTLRARFSGGAGTQYVNIGTAASATTALSFEVLIQNRNATNSQVGGMPNYPVQQNSSSPGVWTTSTATSSVDTTAATTIVITGQKATGAETLTLERYIAQLAYGA
jgi:hypothetical protein